MENKLGTICFPFSLLKGRTAVQIHAELYIQLLLRETTVEKFRELLYATSAMKQVFFRLLMRYWWNVFGCAISCLKTPKIANQHWAGTSSWLISLHVDIPRYPPVNSPSNPCKRYAACACIPDDVTRSHVLVYDRRGPTGFTRTWYLLHPSIRICNAVGQSVPFARDANTLCGYTASTTTAYLIVKLGFINYS